MRQSISAGGQEMHAAGGVRLVVATLLVLVLPCGALAQSVIGVLGIASEIVPIEKRLQESREVTVNGYVFRVGTLNGRQVVVGRSGAGKVNAAIVVTLLIGKFNPSAVFFSGTAGAIDPALHLGDVVIGATVAQHDAGLQAADGLRRRGLRNVLTGDLDPLLVPAPESLLATARSAAQGLRLPPIRTADGEDRSPRIVDGVIVTGDVFLADVRLRTELRNTLGATAVEMEGAAVVQACRQFGVPCLVIRSVTDRADGQASTSYEQFRSVASENAATLVAAVIANLKP
jgi:adenosylhomocysteine nucleosidase